MHVQGLFLCHLWHDNIIWPHWCRRRLCLPSIACYNRRPYGKTCQIPGKKKLKPCVQILKLFPDWVRTPRGTAWGKKTTGPIILSLFSRTFVCFRADQSLHHFPFHQEWEDKCWQPSPYLAHAGDHDDYSWAKAGSWVRPYRWCVLAYLCLLASVQ